MPTTENSAARPDADWWRSAVVYQIYPRSFADANGDGTGDVAGIIDRLPHLVDLGVDALWISPWYPSPLADGGYDVADYTDIHPDFGTLAEADTLIGRAHDAGLRVLIDLVPNHCSDEHPLFRAAVEAGPGSPEREKFIFRDGRGEHGELPPNNWQAMFGGSAWERLTDAAGNGEQWYLHLFDIKQPDWNWDNPAVPDLFDEVLRFWFDRGIDGFRIDVADSMAKDPELPDLPLDADGKPTREKYVGAPMWDVPSLEGIHRRWRAVADEYADSAQGPRVFVSEAYLTPAERLVRYVEEGRLHTTFNFDALLSEWSAESQRNVIAISTAAHQAVGAPCTWVLSNHDTPRVASRYGKPESGSRFTTEGLDPEHIARDWHHYTRYSTDLELGRRRARAAALLEFALPGGAYVYQGDELGLDEVEDLPAEALQDPTWERSGHTVKGRDGCRVPIPWSGSEPPYGFGPAEPGTQPWLPQPGSWADVSVAAQNDDPDSHLALYRKALRLRHEHPAFGDGTFAWDECNVGQVLSFTRDPGLRCMVNFGAEPVDLPAGEQVLLASGELTDGRLGSDQAVWLQRN